MKNAFMPILFVLTVLMSCKTTSETPSSQTDTSVPEAFKGKVLVSLMPDAEIAELEADFSKYELKHLSIASKSKNQHLFGYNQEKISAEALLKKLNKSKEVYLAEALAARMNKATLMSSDEKKQIDIK